MLRSKSGHKIPNKTNETRIKHRRQCNVCVHLLPRAKRNYYNDLENTKRKLKGQCIKTFWKTLGPLFANNIKVRNKIALDEDSQFIKDDEKVTNIFNSFFADTASNLNISYNKPLYQNRDFSEIVEHAIKNL